MSEPSNLVTVTQKRYQCRHVHAGGNQCGSPALRNEEFCYFHHTTRRPKAPAGKLRFLDADEPFELPVVDDLPSALSVAAQLLCRIASNDLDHQRAGKLLYNLQIITSILDKASRAAAKAGAVAKPEPVAELVADDTHGLIAPITEYIPAAPAPPATTTESRYRVAPPQVERDYTADELEYFKRTVVARGYEPRSELPRPASITDVDIQAHANAVRRFYGLEALTARKDADGRLVTFHEQGARYTIPAVVPQPAPDNPQPATIPILQATAHQDPRPGPLLRLRRIRKGQRTKAKQLRSAAGWRAKRSCLHS